MSYMGAIITQQERVRYDVLNESSPELESQTDRAAIGAVYVSMTRAGRLSIPDLSTCTIQ